MHSILLSISALLIANGASAISGVSTFNDYTTQNSVACEGSSNLPNVNQYTDNGSSNLYPAAVGDLSPDLWTGSRCSGSLDGSVCNGSGGVNGSPAGPACTGEWSQNGGVCGQCYTVKCTGSLDGETSGSCTGNTITVQIIDACPSTSPYNYCKTSQFGGNIPPQECCSASGVNALDISQNARGALSSFNGNLNIDIEGPVACPSP